jgi:hypothetical protein
MTLSILMISQSVMIPSQAPPSKCLSHDDCSISDSNDFLISVTCSISDNKLGSERNLRGLLGKVLPSKARQ